MHLFMNQENTLNDEDYDRLMQANLARVFNERDAAQRLTAIAELYAPDAVLNEPGVAAVGHAAISAAVDALQNKLPPTFAFTALGPALGHHDLGRLRWQGGVPGAKPDVHGMDVAHVSHGRIQQLHVFIEPAA